MSDRHPLLDDEGAAPVEFVLVGAILTFLTLAVLQLGFAVYIRNVVHDAAVEGAYHAALADTSLADGAARTADVVARAVGDAYPVEVQAAETDRFGYPATEITVRTTSPVAGLWGVPEALEVTAHAPNESFD
ncbi:TadE/TadG family type IV pilus assembly protein [Microbacterium sp. Clip185]|uniref:TadE/TadG family type IV pilus assembly protein n=1 Tax=Microbacterium sp. Clip185 TaxID=3025663 RepID=UPI002366346A|nr:TadE family protein [Microbacterium sp. Clip185]WDG16856.1 pilus assembly protein [Microbacterium sp. Clip185]